MMRKLERASGVLTMIVGLGSLLWLAFGPWTCSADGTACYGLLGTASAPRLDAVALVMVVWSAVCIAVVGLGAMRGGGGHLAWLARLRWLAVGALALPTLVLLIVSSAGVVMIPAFVLAAWTAAVSEVRARRQPALQSA
jgi:hypothetical protein